MDESEEGRSDAANGEFFQKWIVEICLILRREEMLRFTGLLSGLPEISTRTLSRKLLVLQQLGIIDRTSFDTNPPRVEYRLTHHGRAVAGLLATLHDELREGPDDAARWFSREALRADHITEARAMAFPGHVSVDMKNGHGVKPRAG